MKKKVIKVDKALSLDKETIAKLNEEQLGDLEGGQAAGTTITCNGGAAPANLFPDSCGACSCNG